MKKIIKKLFGIIAITSLLVTSSGIAPLLNVFADVNDNPNNTKLIIRSNNDANQLSIDPDNAKKIVYKIDDTIVGYAFVKIGENELTPEIIENAEGDQVSIALTKYTEDYQVSVYYIKVDGYGPQQSYYYVDHNEDWPGDDILNLDITKNDTHMLDVVFEAQQQQGENQNHGEDPKHDGENNQGEEPKFPIVAFFNNSNEGVEMDADDQIVLPEGFTEGTVTFKAKVCDAIVRENNEDVTKAVPNDGFQQCLPNTERLIEARIEGIVNLDELKGTASGSADRSTLTIKKGFDNYGKIIMHISKKNPDTDPEINTGIRIIDRNLINVKATAPISFSQSLGTANIDQAIITKDVVKDVSIFFGNNETTLKATGTNVDKITAVKGGKSVVINGNGTATVKLPDLSTETTTSVEISIQLKDNTIIKRTVNIKRTAIMLQHSYGGGDDSVYAGYVVNKSYLYGNKDHDDKVFNAYLQVILYKGDMVAGYKQIKIADDKLINDLDENQSGSLDLTDPDHRIAIYGKATNDLIEGVNRISVFLTNGPIDFASNILPSVEFGIGAGVQTSWEALD